MNLFKYFVAVILTGIITVFSQSVQAQSYLLQGWKTNLDKKIIDLNELKAGGPAKDGIPSIDSPVFITQQQAQNWLEDKEPVIVLEINGRTRAYPLQILIWHEIVNDRLGGKHVLVTFCPLCYSAIVFDRRVGKKILEFGVSGFLRHSDMVMYDRSTETLWQQFDGKAIVGDYVGTELEQLPSQLISFEQFREAYPDGQVLSRDTGVKRNYGVNPYVGYDDIDKSPLLFDGRADGRLKPMEKVIGVRLEKQTKGYPYSQSRQKRVINDRLAEKPIVVFHVDGAKSALDARTISRSKEAGSTGAFLRDVDEQTLTFTWENGGIVDEQTGTQWDVTGRAIAGTLEGKQLVKITSGDYFAFAWLVFWPETEIHTEH